VNSPSDDLDPKEAISALWGDLNPEDHEFIHGQVAIQRNPPMGTRMIVMTIRFDRETRVVGGYRHVLEAKEVSGYEYINDMELVAGPARSIYIQVLRDIIKEIGPDLYEYDPRLGITLKDYNGRLPSCPLFDPFPLPYPEWEVRDWSTNIPNETPCPLCGGMFAAHDKPMWGGGNVCWVHADCWGKGLNKEGSNIVVQDKNSAVGVLQPFNPYVYLTVT